VKDDRLYLLHIRESLERIKEYVVEGRDAVFADRKTQAAVLRNLQTVAESSQRLSDSLKKLPSLKSIGGESPAAATLGGQSCSGHLRAACRTERISTSFSCTR
jgi:hypothetical protein